MPGGGGWQKTRGTTVLYDFVQPMAFLTCTELVVGCAVVKLYGLPGAKPGLELLLIAGIAHPQTQLTSKYAANCFL